MGLKLKYSTYKAIRLIGYAFLYNRIQIKCVLCLPSSIWATYKSKKPGNYTRQRLL